MLGLFLDLIGEALLEGVAYLFGSLVLKGFELVQEMWAMLLRR